MRKRGKKGVTNERKKKGGEMREVRRRGKSVSSLPPVFLS